MNGQRQSQLYDGRKLVAPCGSQTRDPSRRRRHGVSPPSEADAPLPYLGPKLVPDLGEEKSHVSRSPAGNESSGCRAGHEAVRRGSPRRANWPIARLGFEPRQREPKSLVLPLHHRAGKPFLAHRRAGLIAARAGFFVFSRLRATRDGVQAPYPPAHAGGLYRDIHTSPSYKPGASAMG